MSATFHPPGSWNGAENLQAFKQDQVGTADGSTSLLTMDNDHGTIVSSGGDSTPTYVHPTVSLTIGTIYDILFSDGTLVRVDEGEGSVLSDSDGNVVGSVTTASENDWWANKVTPAELIAMDAGIGLFINPVDDVPYELSQAQIESGCNHNRQYNFSVCKGLGLYATMYSEYEESIIAPWFFCDEFKGCDAKLTVGVDNDEKVVNGDFELWTDPTVPDEWAYGGTQDATNYVEANVNGVRLVSDGAFNQIAQAIVAVDGGLNRNVIVVHSITGIIGVTNGADLIQTISAPGTYTVEYTGSSTALAIKRLAPCDAVVSMFSNRQVKSNILFPAFFDGAVVDDFNWRTDGDQLIVEMAIGYTPTNPYMELTIAGLRTVLAWDVGSGDYIATGSHVAEDAAIVAYLEANASERVCVMMKSIPAQMFNVVDNGFNVIDNGFNTVYTGIPS